MLITVTVMLVCYVSEEHVERLNICEVIHVKRGYMNSSASGLVHSGTI